METIEIGRISVLDSSIAAYNIGNRIIMEAVKEHLTEMYPNDFIIPLPMEDIKRNARRYCALSKVTFVGGTNLLNCDLRKYRQWDLDLHNIFSLKRLVLMGVGWWKYEDRPITKYTRWALNKILSNEYLHSVRDSYTQKRLSEIGIKSINTGCPTLWNMTPSQIDKLRSKCKSKNVIITITDYDNNPQRDKHLIDICNSCYDNVYIFIQGTGDYNYLRSLNSCANLKIIPPQISKYDEILESGQCDYIGTRLHAGIRALQKNVRTHIISIDNRSKEMGYDFGLPIIQESDLQGLELIINSNYDLDLRIPYEEINRWKSQFLLG